MKNTISMPTLLQTRTIQLQGDYAEGFEGYPVYQFMAVYSSMVKIFRMWEGWFDGIIQEVLPQCNGWTSLALVYHTDKGWFENSPWPIREPKAAIEQLKSTYSRLPSSEHVSICAQLIDFLIQSLEEGAELYIGYD